jgi:hypothetical protein
VELGPFVNLIYFRSPRLRGSAALATAGLTFALRGRGAPPLARAQP